MVRRGNDGWEVITKLFTKTERQRKLGVEGRMAICRVCSSDAE